METKWQIPGIEKVYEAMTAVVSGRVELITESNGKVWSSSGNKFYDISYSPDDKLIMSNDNSSYWKTELGYPAIGFLIKAGYVLADPDNFQVLANIPWKQINQQYRNDFVAAADDVLEGLTKDSCDLVKAEAQKSCVKFSPWT